MNRVLGDAINNYAFAYIDDIIIYSPDIQTHLIHLQTIFDKLKNAQLKQKIKLLQQFTLLKSVNWVKQ